MSFSHIQLGFQGILEDKTSSATIPICIDRFSGLVGTYIYPVSSCTTNFINMISFYLCAMRIKQKAALHYNPSSHQIHTLPALKALESWKEDRDAKLTLILSHSIGLSWIPILVNPSLFQYKSSYVSFIRRL